MSDTEISNQTKDLTLEETPAVVEEFNPSVKKKKTKKSVAFDEDSAAQPEAEAEFDFGKKKKKSSKKKAAVEEEEEAEQNEEEQHDEGEDVFAQEGEETGAEGEAASKEPWLGTDRDYTYTELLSRFFSILRAKNPELAGEKRRYTIVPPSVHRDGSKKTMFTNLVDICKRMNRPAEHVIQFLFTELGTTGSIDGNQYLILKGRFQQKQIEGILRRYIVEYVTCKTCKSPETLLTKENRLFFITCESCGSTRSVATIKSGFMAQTTKRSRVRAAA